MKQNPHNLKQLLLSKSEWFEDQVFNEADKYGYGFITTSMNRLFAHMRYRPMSISELARKLGISRQAVHQTIGEAMRHGLLEFVDSETDKRVKLVQFSERGLEMTRVAAELIAKIEKKLQDQIGKEDLETLRRILSKDWK